MEAEAAADLLAALRARGLRACVGGGWAVGALLGHQTRPHRDLDLAVDATQLGEVMAFLAELGYSPAVDWLPVRVEVADEGGQRVDPPGGQDSVAVDKCRPNLGPHGTSGLGFSPLT